MALLLDPNPGEPKNNADPESRHFICDSLADDGGLTAWSH